LNGAAPNVLLQAVTTVLPYCQLKNKTGEYCTFDLDNKGTNVCLGDSGGPLMYSINDTFYLYGITSHGSDCDDESFFVAVPNYNDWIASVVRL
jgi:secreted trypsin-like serine protease